MKNDKPTLSGILGFPVSPLNSQGKLDLKAFEKNIKFMLDEGLQTLFVGCGAGEFHALSHHEYREMVETAVSIANDRASIYTGVGGNLSHSIELAEISERLGAKGYLILPPYLIDPEQEGLYQYVNQIVSSTSLDAIIYQRDNCILTVETLRRLINNAKIVGFKDGAGKMEFNVEATKTLGNRLVWMNGMPLAEMTMPAYMNLGFKSYSSAIANYIPHISLLFYDALFQHREELLRELYQFVILPIHRLRLLRKGYSVALIKAGMDIVGLSGTTVRPPIVPVEVEHYRQLEQILKVAFERFPK